MAVALAVVLVVASAGCSGDDDPSTSSTLGSMLPDATPDYRATLHRSANGVAHVEAEDLASAGFGTGWAAAEDHACTLAEAVVSARGERARWFGPGPRGANVDGDVTMATFGVPDRGRAAVAELTPDAAALMEGYAAGVRAWHAEVGPAGADGSTDGRDGGGCAGLEVLADVDVASLLAVQYRLALADDLELLTTVATATPPGEERPAPVTGSSEPTPGPAVPTEPKGTAWAIGAEMTDTGRGALVTQPLLDWEGATRLWEHQLRVPGSLDVYGATFVGLPVPVMGFTEALAFSPVPSPSPQGSAYRLALVPGEPTAHLVDGTPEALVPEHHTVEVLDGGTPTTVERTTWRSRFGPVVEAPGLAWSEATALAWHDVVLSTPPMVNALVDLARSEGTAEVAEALGRGGAPAWAATVVATEAGVTWYGDTAATPALSDATRAAFAASLDDPVVASAAAEGLVVLDGSRPAPPGDDALAPVDAAPTLERRDYVVGTGSGSWLANPDEPLLEGDPTRRSEPRGLALSDRQSILVLRSMLDEAHQTGGRLGLVTLQEAMLGERDLAADLLLDDVVERCRRHARVAVPEVRLASGTVHEAGTVEVGGVCSALAGWDRTFTLESRGALLWRTFLEQFDRDQLTVAGEVFEVAFRQADPLRTPRLLRSAPEEGPDPIVVALAIAALELAEVDVPLDATLRDVQWAQRGEERIPMHGGAADLGSLSGVDTVARDGGFEVVGGPAYLLAVTFTDGGPVAEALLAYGQSDRPDAMTFADQTYRYSDRAWRPVRFSADELEADPALETREVVGMAERP